MRNFFSNIFGSQAELSPVQEILQREYKTHNDVRVAISDLSEINTPDAPKAIVELFKRSKPDFPCFPIFSEDLMTQGISALKGMRNPEYNLGSLLTVEKIMHDGTNNPKHPAYEKVPLGARTHEKEVVAAMEEIGGPRLEYAITNFVGLWYSEESEKALERLALSKALNKMDEPDQPEASDEKQALAVA